MLKILRKLLVVVALPVSLLVVGCMFLSGCKKDRGPVHDPVHAPQNEPQPEPGDPQVCDPVHEPPPPQK